MSAAGALLDLTDTLDQQVSAIFDKVDNALIAPYDDEAVKADEAQVLQLLESLERALQENMLDTLMPCAPEVPAEQTVKVVPVAYTH